MVWHEPAGAEDITIELRKEIRKVVSSRREVAGRKIRQQGHWLTYQADGQIREISIATQIAYYATQVKTMQSVYQFLPS